MARAHAWRACRGQQSTARHVALGGTEAPTGGPRRGNRQLTDGSLVSAIFQFQKTSKITFPHNKNRYKVRKNLGKFMEVGDEIWNTFHN
jgi:hypothetical protein